MEVDEIQRQVCKFQRVSSNGSTTTTDNNNSSIPQKLATSRTNFDLQNHDDNNNTGRGGGGGGIDAGGVAARLCGWPSSRIVRVSRASGGKDRHSKVLTSKGLRDRRVRLSVGTAIQFYDLQDRLGFDQPSKAVEWLLKAAASSIDELPSLDLPFPGTICNEKIVTGNGGNNNTKAIRVKSPSCSSTSETSKGSGLSLSRSENRIKARERARVITASKKNEGVRVMNQVTDGVFLQPADADVTTVVPDTTIQHHHRR
ncbi:hypothetical protein QVD17_33156 [Tagetes erecta]|uniref:TCP domain-containing protein n=1 Tax=Tagetes erecta TaxID=13708 RepID=A0AAD8JZ76_TARER|nr:hypothetical protein QVD17_33156 [Tagetes erecta]